MVFLVYHLFQCPGAKKNVLKKQSPDFNIAAMSWITLHLPWF